jgi:hypothetical protein
MKIKSQKIIIEKIDKDGNVISKEIIENKVEEND